MVVRNIGIQELDAVDVPGLDAVGMGDIDRIPAAVGADGLDQSRVDLRDDDPVEPAGPKGLGHE